MSLLHLNNKQLFLPLRSALSFFLWVIYSLLMLISMIILFRRHSSLLKLSEDLTTKLSKVKGPKLSASTSVKASLVKAALVG